MSQAGSSPSGVSNVTRWTQLIVGILCMVMIANLQYGWTLFVNPMDAKYHWGRASIQVAFTLFILLETWLVPVEGYLVDRFGPKLVVLFGGILAGLGWVVNSYASTLPMLYFGNILAGLGAGAVYGTCIGNALKWFPDRRGFAAGMTAMGFGIGSATTIVPIANMIKSSGYESAFLTFGIGQGVVVIVLSFFLFAPRADQVPPVSQTRTPSTRRHYRPLEIVKEPVFWVMYVMFVLVAAGGLMATAQLGPIAKDFNVAQVPVTLLGITLPALTFGAAIDRITNGVTRPFFGWISDYIGRENTMFLAFAVEAVGILLLFAYGTDPVGFVILSGLVFFAWGEIFSLFPATCTDCFGSDFAAANAGLLYTAKGTASLVVPVVNILVAATGGWKSAFVIAAAFNVIAAVMALVVLKPMRQAVISRSNAAMATATSGASPRPAE